MHSHTHHNSMSNNTCLTCKATFDTQEEREKYPM